MSGKPGHESSALPPAISRRAFVKTGGALFVSLAIPLRFDARMAPPENNANNTILACTGRTETGVGITGYYPQMIAEELNVRPAIPGTTRANSYMLGVPVDKVVVRWMDQSGQYGRTTLGGDGAEADAVILSQLTGKPVRVQWTLAEDLAWSTVSPAWVSELTAALDAKGHIVALHSANYAPHMFDPRPLGALLVGMPSATSKPGNWVATEWPYDKIVNRLEDAYGMPNLAGDSPNGGLRGNIMRTPGQRQQNLALESLMNEAAASAGEDPIQFRLAHTTDERLINLLRATAEAANWETRPSPHRGARRSGSAPVKGRGICVMIRENAYWVGIAELSVVPTTGEVKMTRFTIGGEPGKIINPRQLDRCMRSGAVMGLSEALKEAVTFDNSRVTSTNWSRYKILNMEEMLEIQVVQLSRDDTGFGGGFGGGQRHCPTRGGCGVLRRCNRSSRPPPAAYVRTRPRTVPHERPSQSPLASALLLSPFLAQPLRYWMVDNMLP